MICTPKLVIYKQWNASDFRKLGALFVNCVLQKCFYTYKLTQTLYRTIDMSEPAPRGRDVPTHSTRICANCYQPEIASGSVGEQKLATGFQMFL